MGNIKLESVTCDICDTSNSITLFEAHDYRYGHQEMFSFVECLSCGLTYLNPRPVMDSIIGLYETDYSLENEQINVPKLETNRWKNLVKKMGRKTIGSYTDEILELADGKVLDIGCGSGYLLLSLKEKGCEVFGLEANQNAVDVCADSGLNVFKGTLEEARYQDRSFDVVILSQVIEHLQSPRKTLKEIYRILKPGGKILVYCPNVKSYLTKVFGKYWHGWHIPFHFYGLDGEAIRNMATKSHFVVSQIRTVTPTRFFIESMKSCLWPEKGYCNIEYAKRIMYVLNPALMILISPVLRGVDLLFPENGDCLKIVMTKAG